MKKKCFVFCHGFGFDKSFWNNLRHYFDKESCVYLDLGYFQDKDLKLSILANVDYIAIGHSLGLIKLLKLNINFKYVIGINSFLNFLGKNTSLQDRRKLELKALTQQFIKSPIYSLNQFYLRCGLVKTLPHSIQINREDLLFDLKLLDQSFTINKNLPMFILNSTDDIIIPQELVDDNFLKYKNIKVKLIKHNTHLLGYYQAALISQEIREYLKLYEQTANIE